LENPRGRCLAVEFGCSCEPTAHKEWNVRVQSIDGAVGQFWSRLASTADCSVKVFNMLSFLDAVA